MIESVDCKTCDHAAICKNRKIMEEVGGACLNGIKNHFDVDLYKASGIDIIIKCRYFAGLKKTPRGLTGLLKENGL